MRKLMYLIVVIVALGLIVAGCIPTVPPTGQGELDNLEMISVSKSVGPIVIDGILTTGEWDDYLLGTSVTIWGGGMSVNVYGYADDTYLYAAYLADMSQPGWSVGASLGVSNNLYYKTPQSVEWPDSGYTLLAAGGYPDDVLQTDGTGWENKGSFAVNDVEIYSGDGMYHTFPNPNVAEVKIPLSLLTYAGDDGQIALSGQYWQNDFATPFYVALPPTELEVEIDIKPGSDPNSINLGSKGVVPVAVLTTDAFDASDIVPDTVTFAGAEPVRCIIEDVDGDGDLDMLFHFKTQELDLTKESTVATLTGETQDGISIEGTDTVNIVPKK